jgi:serine/threonine protein phosphatase PrpC
VPRSAATGTGTSTAAILVCAADGVSSAPLSHAGAAEACRLLRDLAAPRVSKFFRASRDAQWISDLWEDLAECISTGMNAFAAQHRIEPKELSTTLAAALIEANPINPVARRYIILNVGDARAFLLHDGQFIPCLPEAHASSDAITSTATSALPTSVGQVGTAVGVIRQQDMLMVCSDGMSDPMVDPGVRDRLANWWDGERIPSVLEYGWQVGYRIATYDDDRTAVCVWGHGQ